MLLRRLILASAFVGFLEVGSCSKRPPSSAQAQPPNRSVYQVRGIIRAVDVPGGTLEIQHEEIPGYMPAMVMPFTLRDPGDAKSFEPGQAISFEFVVTKDDSWITNLKKLANSTLLVAPTAKPSSPARHRLKEGEPVPDFELITQTGQPFTRKDLTGHQSVLTFIFTRCPVPNFCPLMAQKFVELQKAIQGTPELESVRLISVTIDPEFDTPEVLSQYAERVGANSGVWTFVTGKPKEIDQLAAAFAVHRENEYGSISHSLTTALIAPDGMVRQIWRGNFWKPAEVVQALQEGSRSHSNPPPRSP